MPVLEKGQNTDFINKRLLVKEVVQKLHYFTDLYAIESLFIAGGFCRSLYFNRLWDVNDIDVASAYENQALQLGGLFASEVLHQMPEIYRRTGTAVVVYESEFGKIRVEFQGSSVNPYMHNEEVRNWMHAQEIADIPLMHNIYSRDFTINSLTYSLHTAKLCDPTGKAGHDLDKKLIVSLLPAEMLVKHNPLAILRAIRFALTYNFYIDKDLSNAMNDGLGILRDTIPEERIIKDIVKILKIDGPAGLKMLKRYGLDRTLLNQEIKDYIHLESEDE